MSPCCQRSTRLLREPVHHGFSSVKALCAMKLEASLVWRQRRHPGISLCKMPGHMHRANLARLHSVKLWRASLCAATLRQLRLCSTKASTLLRRLVLYGSMWCFPFWLLWRTTALTTGQTPHRWPPVVSLCCHCHWTACMPCIRITFAATAGVALMQHDLVAQACPISACRCPVHLCLDQSTGLA